MPAILSTAEVLTVSRSSGRPSCGGRFCLRFDVCGCVTMAVVASVSPPCVPRRWWLSSLSAPHTGTLTPRRTRSTCISKWWPPPAVKLSVLPLLPLQVRLVWSERYGYVDVCGCVCFCLSQCVFAYMFNGNKRCRVFGRRWLVPAFPLWWGLLALHFVKYTITPSPSLHPLSPTGR